MSHVERMALVGDGLPPEKQGLRFAQENADFGLFTRCQAAGPEEP